MSISIAPPSNPLLLPELLYQTHKHLTSPQDLFRAMQVSRAWYISASPLLWKHIAFLGGDCLEYNIRCMNRITEFAKVCNSWEGDRRHGISRSGCEERICSGEMSIFCKRNPKKLKEKKLSISRLLCIPNSVLRGEAQSSTPPKSLQNYARHIRSFTIRSIKDSNLDQTLLGVARNCHNLQYLELFVCTSICDATISAFVDAGKHSPHEFNTNLRAVALPGCQYLTDAAIIHLAKCCPTIEVLDLRACNNISDISLLEVAEKCSRLKHLNVGRIRDNAKVTAKSIIPLAKGTRLKVLGLAGCEVTDECMVILAKERGEEMERISLNNCPKLTNISARIFLQKCPHLTVFEIKACANIDDWAVILGFLERNVLLTMGRTQLDEFNLWAARNHIPFTLKMPRKV